MSSKLKYEDNMFYCSLFPIVYTPQAKNKSKLFTVVVITSDAFTQMKKRLQKKWVNAQYSFVGYLVTLIE